MRHLPFSILAALAVACATPATDDAGAASADAGAPDDGGAAVDAGGGLDGSTPTDAGPQDAGAELFADCDDYARWACDTTSCPFDGLVAVFGGVARCERLLARGCRQATADGAQFTPSDAARCAMAFDCRAEAPLGAPGCEYVPGTRALGEPCITFTQCGAHEGVPMYCDGVDLLTDEGCEPGVCAEATPVGELCDGEVCAPPASCLTILGTGERRCAAEIVRGEAGDPCQRGSDRDCAWELKCIEGECRPGVEEGEPCDTIDECARGLSCTFPMGDDPRICRDVDRLIGEDCTGPYDRCPILGSTCVEGVCAETGSAGGGPCDTIADCEPLLTCLPDGTCGYAVCPG